jgi:hypothetical protein
MPLSTDVSLPKSWKAIFPNRCVACGRGYPGGSIRVGTFTIGWWTYLFWSYGRWFAVDVPACDGCRRRIVLQRWLRRVICLGLIVVGVWIASSWLGPLRGLAKRWAAMGIVLVGLIPWFAWEILFPRPIDLTARADTVDYEFRDADYANDFACMNMIVEVDLDEDD